MSSQMEGLAGELGRRSLLSPGALAAGRRLLFEESSSLSTGTTIGYAFICVALVIFSGMMAGLTLGLLSLDKMDLEVIKRSGTDHEKWLVAKIEPVVRRPHYLLATLLLCNAAAMETLPIFLDRLLNPVAAILISVTAILIFGEIIPQAVCKRYGLTIGAYLAWLVRLLMLITGIITWPIGKILDWMLGEESALYRRHELKAMVTLHAEPQDDGATSALTTDEVQVIQGALDMATKTAESAMTPMEKVFMVSSEDVINDELLQQIIAKGHSRVPVFDGHRQDVIGLILVKELLLVDEDRGVQVNELRIRELPCLRADIPLYDTLKLFRMGRSHMACLTRVTTKMEKELLAAAAGGQQDASVHSCAGGSMRRGKSLQRFFRPSPNAASSDLVEEIIGIITIEDVLEELLGQEIVDETDQYVDNLQTVRTSRLNQQQLPANIRRFLTRQTLGKPGARPTVAANGPRPKSESVTEAVLAGAVIGNAIGEGPGALAAGAAVGAVVADSMAAQEAEGGMCRVDMATKWAAAEAAIAVAHAVDAEAERGCCSGGGGAGTAGVARGPVTFELDQPLPAGAGSK